VEEVMSRIIIIRDGHSLYSLHREKGETIPAKHKRLYEAAPRMFAALEDAIRLIPIEKNEERQKILRLIEEILGGKKSNDYRDYFDINQNVE